MFSSHQYSAQVCRYRCYTHSTFRLVLQAWRMPIHTFFFFFAFFFFIPTLPFRLFSFWQKTQIVIGVWCMSINEKSGMNPAHKFCTCKWTFNAGSTYWEVEQGVCPCHQMKTYCKQVKQFNKADENTNGSGQLSQTSAITTSVLFFEADAKRCQLVF